MSDATEHPHPHFPVRHDWLALHDEPVLDADLAIVDPHHHLWNRTGNPYFLDDFLADAGGGHRIVASVFVQCFTMYRATGPQAMRCVGETEFANGAAAMAASGEFGGTLACAGIVAYGDLRLGADLAPVLEAHARTAGPRFKGIRDIAAWHPDPAARGSISSPPPDLLTDPRAATALDVLGRLGASFDTFLYHTQLGELAALARRCPAVTVIVNHTGGIIGIGPYAGRRDAARAEWRAGLTELAACPNVVMKLGGLGMRVFGHDFGDRERPPDSTELAAAWRPYLDTCIELFGAERCMFESNFPVDKGSCSYRVLWNAFKRIADGASDRERAALFHDTAARVYRLPL